MCSSDLGTSFAAARSISQRTNIPGFIAPFLLPISVLTEKFPLCGSAAGDISAITDREGRRVKFFYCLPNFHNPAGVSLSAERRPRVVEICRRHRILIIEDNPYGLLGFEGQTRTALKTIAPDDVVYLSSFSKIFAPGYRVGWAVAPPAVREKMKLASEAAILCPSSVGQYSIAMYLDSFD